MRLPSEIIATLFSRRPGADLKAQTPNIGKLSPFAIARRARRIQKPVTPPRLIRTDHHEILERPIIDPGKLQYQVSDN
jgi:hypothetical protein